MKSIRNLMLNLVVIFVSVVSYADPIEDMSMKNYKAGWYPNFIQGNGPMTCPKTCDAWVGARAEQEKSNDVEPESERAAVCKVTRDKSIIYEGINDPSSHWIYGNQYDDEPVCYVARRNNLVKRSEYFMCLCVEPDECRKADLIVSKIHDPVWDHGAGQSIVKVDVTNIGASAAGLFYTRLLDPGTGAASTQGVAGLAAGATVTLTFYFSYWVFDPDASLTATADIYNQQAECDEGNNTLSYFKQG
ncbi:CARDB domain-containing protein [Pleionea sp. CnH1-48]|uniref:CARDB domain-containing protein n=1 Tax=Pleionea sp. CnH1-48 TaxID=2954494 RepID=UPI0020981DB0|nr:CARDB domain-containing protein [Pleionea sp. CnH1-48]MCO7225338.1 hypothetical protein [Pleionea sp. CnH1-48]